MNPNNGEVLAMVGSVDYWNTDDSKVDGNVNVAINVRQMGSSMKPYAYLTSFLQGYGPWLEAPDISSLKFGNWDLENWDSKYQGLMTARKALVNSRNVSAAYIMQLVGIDAFIETAEKLGVTTLSDKSAYGLSLVLGSGEISLLEHVAAYSVFANEGVRNETTAILKVEDSDGEIIYEKEDTEGTRVFEEQEIYALNWILCDLGYFRDRPFASSYVINGQNICGKTGTTNGPTDLVAILYHPNLTVGVWAGNNDNTEVPGAWATTVTLPIANSIVARVSDKYEIEAYTRPSGILSTTVCTDTGATPGEDTKCNKEKSIYISGSAPQSDPREVIKLCKGEDFIPSNLSSAVKYGLVEETTVLEFNLENSLQQSAYELYISKNDNYDFLVEMPGTDVCDLPLGEDDAPVVEMTSPSNGESVERGSTIEINGSFRVLDDVSSVSTFLDSAEISSDYNADNTFSNTYEIPFTTTLGAHIIKVKVTDSDGKSTNASVSINVQSSSSISITISSPSGGSTVTIPQIITATVVGEPDSVSFHIDKTDGTYSKTYPDFDGADGWSVNWNDGDAPSGNYEIEAVAIKGTSTYVSDIITISL